MGAARLAGRRRGFSIIEMMIALALGSAVTLGVVQLFTVASAGYALSQGQSRALESARFAFSFIGRSVRHAGYRGCFSDPAAMRVAMADVPYEFDLRAGVTGHDGTGTGWNPPLTPLPRTSGGVDANVWNPDGLLVNGRPYNGSGKGIDTRRVIYGTDVLTLRSLSVIDRKVAAPVPASAQSIMVRSPAPPDELAFDRGHAAMIHDCEKATIFRVTRLSENGDLTAIWHHADDTDRWGNSRAPLAAFNAFGAGAAVSAVESHTYFLARGIGINAQGNSTISLWRKSGLRHPVELVEGVEDMQILYGIDRDLRDRNLAPGQYVTAPEVVDWRGVRTVRVTLVVSSVDDVGGESGAGMAQACGERLNAAGDTRFCHPGEGRDGQARRTFSQVFQLRNRS